MYTLEFDKNNPLKLRDVADLYEKIVFHQPDIPPKAQQIQDSAVLVMKNAIDDYFQSHERKPPVQMALGFYLAGEMAAELKDPYVWRWRYNHSFAAGLQVPIRFVGKKHPIPQLLIQEVNRTEQINEIGYYLACMGAGFITGVFGVYLGTPIFFK